jgi:hypothetical protein
MRSIVGTHILRGLSLAAPYCLTASLPNGVQSLRQREICVSAARDKLPDGLQVLRVSGLKSRAFVDYKTTVVGVRKSDVDISVPRSQLFSQEVELGWLGKAIVMRTVASTLKMELMSDDLPERLCYESLQSINVRLTQQLARTLPTTRILNLRDN